MNGPRTWKPSCPRNDDDLVGIYSWPRPFCGTRPRSFCCVPSGPIAARARAGDTRLSVLLRLKPGLERDRLVNSEGSVNQRFREFGTEIPGCGRNLAGSLRTLVAISRNRVRGPASGIVVNPCGITPRARNARQSISRRRALTGVGFLSVEKKRAPPKPTLFITILCFPNRGTQISTATSRVEVAFGGVVAEPTLYELFSGCDRTPNATLSKQRAQQSPSVASSAALSTTCWGIRKLDWTLWQERLKHQSDEQ